MLYGRLIDDPTHYTSIFPKPFKHPDPRAFHPTTLMNWKVITTFRVPRRPLLSLPCVVALLIAYDYGLGDGRNDSETATG